MPFFYTLHSQINPEYKLVLPVQIIIWKTTDIFLKTMYFGEKKPQIVFAHELQLREKQLLF